MTVWMAAVIALLPGFAVPTWFAARGRIAERLVAVQLATAMAELPPLCLALLTLPSTLLMALFVERWL